MAISFFKVKPGKTDAYTSLVKANMHKMLEKEFRDKQVLGWYFYEVIMPAGELAPYDFVSVVISGNFGELVDNASTLKESYAAAFTNAPAQQFQNFSNQMQDCRSLVKREIYVHRGGINTKTPVSRYVQIDYMKPFDGKANDYVRMEKEIYYPIHQERIKLGALTDWGLYQRLLPYSETAESDFLTANFFNNPRSIIDPKYEEAFNNMPNNIDYIRLSAQIDQTRKLVRSDVWKLVDYVDQNNTR